MIQTHKYIHNQIQPLDVDQQVTVLQDFFLGNDFQYFPIADKGVYIGSVSAEDAETFDPHQKIGAYRYALDGFFVREQTNWLDVLDKFAQNQVDVMPILGQDNQYIGYYTLLDIVQLFSETSFLREPGGIIVVEKPFLEYSASEIAQIIESNGYKLLGMFVSELESKVQVYIKVNAENLNEILQTFRRYQYDIVSEHSEDTYIKGLKERLDYIDKYLNI